MTPPSTRRWTRHQVKLPVRIIAPNETSEITVPGLTTESSQGGMALYGGVPLQPGDVMAVEFETSNRLRVAALVRDRYGYCFGLEFLGLLPSEATEIAGPDLSQIAEEPAVYGEDEMLALYLKKHEAYLR